MVMESKVMMIRMVVVRLGLELVSGLVSGLLWSKTRMVISPRVIKW